MYYQCFEQEDADKRVNEIISRDTHDGIYTYDAWWDISNADDTVTLDYYYTSEITLASYQRVRNDLGTGWSWSFPSVHTIKSDYDDINEMPSALYYHDGKGNVLEVKYDDLNGCWFENYVGGDITFDIVYNYDSSIVNTTRIDYMVENSDGTEYYFGPHGEIRTIMDMYGNKITFGYNDKDFYGAEDMPILSRITDTVGRVVRFYYETEGEYEVINVVVTSPFENEKTLELSYKKKMIDLESTSLIRNEDGDIVESEPEYISTEPFLESFTNALGETTSYYPAPMNGYRTYTQDVYFTFADKNIDSDFVYNTGGYKKNFVYLLGNIVRPHSNTYYCYDLCERNLGHSGISEAYRIEERGDDLLVVDNDDNIIDGYSNNVVEYTYSRDYTGYPFYNSVESIDENDYVCRTKEIRENATYKREFYKKDEAVLKQEEEIIYTNPVGNNLKVTYNVEEFLYKQPTLTKVTYDNSLNYTYDSYVYNEFSTAFNKTFGKPLILTEEIDYDTFLDSDREKHAMLYTYDDDTGFMLSKSWYKSASSKCTENYTYDANNRLSSVRLADGTTTSYSYQYTNGHVSKITATTPNDTGTTVVEENYTSATGYSLPSSVTKTVTDGDNTKSQTTTYTYDFVGNLIGIKDANGNLNSDGYTQKNTYDKINRLTSSKNAYDEILRNTYDNAGNIKKQVLVDSSGAESILYQRAFDGEGKIVSDTDNASNSNTYHYNNLGQLVQTVDKDSKLHNVEYNESGTVDAETKVKPNELLTAKNYGIVNPYGTEATFGLRGVYREEYDNYGVFDTQTTLSLYSPMGKLLNQSSTYAYDTWIDKEFISYVDYTYDSAGNIISTVYGTADNTLGRAFGATTHYEYDKNRVVEVQIDGNLQRNTSASSNVSYEYYPDGKLKSITYPELTDNTILKTEYVYDGASRLTSLINYKGTNILSSYAYTYDSNGNILTVTEIVGETQHNTSYTYDKLNRISTVSGTKGADSYYEYDSRGNRKVNFEQIDFLSEENAEFAYDEEDQLYYANVGSDTTTFEYSSNGYRYVKRENESYPEFYIYDEQGRLQAIAEPANVTKTDGSIVTTMFPTVQYIWGLTEFLQR